MFVLVLVVLGGFLWCGLCLDVDKVGGRAGLYSGVDQFGVGREREGVEIPSCCLI